MGRVFQEERPAAPLAAITRNVAYGALPRQKLDIYLPKTGKPRAVIVFFYGGAWASGAKWPYRPLGAAFTGRGYALVVPNYRLYPSARFPAFVEDGALALKWTLDNAALFGQVPVFVMGHSAGAHIGALLALDARYLRAHGVDPSSIRGFIGISGPYTLNPAKWPVMREIFAAADPPETARPIRLVQERTTPMLLLHGSRDRVVAVHNSARLAEALQGVGSAAATKIYSSIGHNEMIFAFVWGWRWRASALDDVDAFIKSLL
jgi:acetyl esterase/lipase